MIIDIRINSATISVYYSVLKLILCAALCPVVALQTAEKQLFRHSYNYSRVLFMVSLLAHGMNHELQRQHV